MAEFEIRADRQQSRGRRPLVREREEYFRLMAEGVGSRQACRIVGINRQTGKRWRNGRTEDKQRLRAVVPPKDVAGRYLTVAERVYIADRLREKAGLRVIGAERGRAPSTISREVRRNAKRTGAYRPHAADDRARVRRRRPKTGKIEGN